MTEQSNLWMRTYGLDRRHRWVGEMFSWRQQTGTWSRLGEGCPPSNTAYYGLGFRCNACGKVVA